MKPLLLLLCVCAANAAYDDVQSNSRLYVKKSNWPFLRYRRQSSLKNGFTVEMQRQIVNHHNLLRTKTKPSAANMLQMVWNEDLATMAQGWANECKWQHGQPRTKPPTLKWGNVGQNLYSNSRKSVSSATGTTGVQKWFDEEQWHTYLPNGIFDNGKTDCQAGKVCGHYTQVVWAKSYAVGCGIQICDAIAGLNRGGTVMVCNYGDPGNYLRRSVYEEGKPCSNCPASHPKCSTGTAPGLCQTSQTCNGLKCAAGQTLLTDACICKPGSGSAQKTTSGKLTTSTQKHATKTFPSSQTSTTQKLLPTTPPSTKAPETTQISVLKNGFTVEMQRQIVNHHNLLRTKTKPSAANMLQMVWNEDLATMAQGWANECKWQHGQPRTKPPTLKWGNVGQNLYSSSRKSVSSATGTTGVQKWFDEEQWHTYLPNGIFDNGKTDCQAGKVCGHYTQVVWAKSYAVGCGIQICDAIAGLNRGGTVMVCNYGDPGNYLRRSVYEEGKPCSNCPASHPKCSTGTAPGLCQTAQVCGGMKCGSGETLLADACICTKNGGPAVGTSAPRTTTKPAAVTKPTNNKELMSCTFEGSLCSFQYKKTNTFQWGTRVGATPSSQTGPNTDATGSPRGTYLYTEASGSTAGDKAEFTTAAYTLPSGSACLRFSYHMYGTNMGTLRVLLQRGSTTQQLITRAGDQGNRWVTMRFTLSGVSQPIKFTFEATRGNGFRSDIAVDNISLSDGRC